MKRFMHDIEKNVSSLLLVAILVVLSIQVFSRYLFQHSPSWSEELARFLFIWFIYISISYAAQKNAHITIDSFLGIYPPAARPYIKKLGILVWLAFNVVIIYCSIVYTWKIMEVNQVAVGVKISLWTVYISIPLGYILMSVRLVQRLLAGSAAEEEKTTEVTGGL